MRDSAMRSSVTPCSDSRLPNATRDLRALAHQFQRAFGHADGAHAVVNAARPKTPLRDFETASLAEQQILGRHAYIHEIDFGVPVRRVIVAEHGQRAQHLDARRFHRHQDHGLLAVPVRPPDWSCP